VGGWVGAVDVGVAGEIKVSDVNSRSRELQVEIRLDEWAARADRRQSRDDVTWRRNDVVFVAEMKRFNELDLYRQLGPPTDTGWYPPYTAVWVSLPWWMHGSALRLALLLLRLLWLYCCSSRRRCTRQICVERDGQLVNELGQRSIATHDVSENEVINSTSHSTSSATSILLVCYKAARWVDWIRVLWFNICIILYKENAYITLK